MSQEFVIYVSTVTPDGKVLNVVGFPTFDEGIAQLELLTKIVGGGDPERHPDKGYSISKGEKLHVIGRVNRSAYVEYEVRGYPGYPHEAFTGTFDTYGEAVAKAQEITRTEPTHFNLERGETRYAPLDDQLPHYYIEPRSRKKEPTWTLSNTEDDELVEGIKEGHTLPLEPNMKVIEIEFSDGSVATYTKD